MIVRSSGLTLLLAAMLFSASTYAQSKNPASSAVGGFAKDLRGPLGKDLAALARPGGRNTDKSFRVGVISRSARTLLFAGPQRKWMVRRDLLTGKPIGKLVAWRKYSPMKYVAASGRRMSNAEGWLRFQLAGLRKLAPKRGH